jgi:hypothetical protein
MTRTAMILVPLLLTAAAVEAEEKAKETEKARESTEKPSSPLPRYELALARVSASAALRGDGAANVLDDNLTTAWCTSPSAPGQTLTIDLARPLAVDRVVISVGITDDNEDVQHRPGALDVALDDAAPRTHKPDHADSDRIIVDAPGATVKKVTVRLHDPGGGRACISGVALERARQAHSLLHRLNERKLEALRAAISRLGLAVSRCDAAGFGELAAFPLTWSSFEDRGEKRRAKHKVRHLGELLEMCKPAPFAERAVHELDAETVSVWAEGDWILKWRRSDWSLVGLPDGYGQP